MTRINLFERTDNLQTMLTLQNELIQSKLFKLPDGKNKKYALTEKSDISKNDVCIVESNVSDFITVWARHERKGNKRQEKASYGVRIKTSLGHVPSISALLGNMNTSFNDSNEYRIALYSADDVKLFVTKILMYSQVHAINRNATKEVATASATIA